MWLYQIVAERKFQTYDEAILFLVAEWQRNLPSKFGIFPELDAFVCDGKD